MQTLELISLQKRYGDTLALKRADLTARAGEVVAICGREWCREIHPDLSAFRIASTDRR